MFSFLNGKSPFDEAEEKLEAGETVNGRPKLPQAPIMGWQDGVFLLVLVVARHEQFHTARFAEGRTEHEEGNKKHKHIHHRREVDADVDFLLFAFFFLCHYYSPPIFSM